MPYTCQKCLIEFTRKHNYNKHRELCVFDINYNNELISDIESSRNLPSYNELYNFVLVLSSKVSKLEKENKNIKDIISNKLLKMKPAQWLNDNASCNITFENWYKTFDVSEYLQLVFNNDLITGIVFVIETVYKNTDNPPLYAFDNKKLQFFIYENSDINSEWTILSSQEFDIFINHISNLFIISFSNFLTNNEYLVRESKYIDKFNAYQIKVYGSANVINRNNKIRQMLYNNIKSNVSNVQIS